MPERVETASLKVTKALRDQIFNEKGRTRKPMHVLADEAWECYTRAKASGTKPPEISIQPTAKASHFSHTGTEEERLYVEKLLSVLRSGDKLTRRAIRSNLDVFSRYVEVHAHEEPSSVPPGKAPADIGKAIESVRGAEAVVERMAASDPRRPEDDPPVETPAKG